MKAMRLEDDWGLENIRLRDLPDPEPGPDDIVIGIEAVSINPRDRLQMLGAYGRIGGSPPIIPLCDGAGRVHAVGENVTRFKPGDFVCPNFSRTWISGTASDQSQLGMHGGPIDGTMCELMLVPEHSVVMAPQHMRAAEAATLPCAAVTAWNALIEQGHLTAGQTVVLQGTGGVSLFALQIAKMHGARVIVTSSSDDKLARVRELGTDHTINYRQTPDWHKTVRDLTGGTGADHVIDVGGSDTLDKSVSAVRSSGTVSVIGVLGGVTSQIQLGKVVTRNVRLQGVTVGSREMFERMVAAMELNGVRPVTDDTGFAFEDLPAALARLPEGKHFGKVVCAF